MKKDYFHHRAVNYEQDTRRIDNVQNIADSILKRFTFDQSMEIMDFGAGTGLLLEKMAPYVKKITAIDISPAMIKTLELKRDSLPCELEIKEMDLSQTQLDEKFQGIISSLTMHHIKDIQAMFRNFYAMLNEGGIIAISDLDLEDGSFHQEDTGIFHFGFDRDVFLNYAKVVGFKNLEISYVSTFNKSNGEFPIFLLTGVK